MSRSDSPTDPPSRRRVGISTQLSAVGALILATWLIVGVVATRASYRDARDRARADANTIAQLAVAELSTDSTSGFISDFAATFSVDDPRSCDVALQFVSFGYLALLDEAGEIVCTSLVSPPDALTDQLSDPAVVEQLVAVAATTPQKLVPDPGGNGWVAVYAARAGVRGQLLFFQYIQSSDFAGALGGRDGAAVMVVDKATGQIMNHTGSSDSGSASDGRPPEAPDAEARFAPASQDDQTLTAADPLDGRRRIWAVDRGPVARSWTIAAGVAEADAVADARDFRNRMAQLTGVIVVALLLGAWSSRRFIVRPLHDMTATIDRARSDRSARVPVAGPRELAELAVEYNAMSDVRLAAEVEMTRQLEFVNALAASLGEGTYAVDGRNRITFVNMTALQMVGRDQSIMGADAHEVFHSNPDGGGDCVWCRLSATDRLVHIDEDHLATAAGRRVPVTVTLSPIRSADGSFGTVVTFTDITERKAFEAQLAHQALHDPLTSLPNRVLFNDRVEHALSARVRNRREMAVIFLDLDRFKLVNDSLGHDAGDRVLVEVAQRVAGAVRAGDTVARFGGDEFVILIEDIPAPDAAMTVAEHLLEVLRQPIQLDHHSVVCTASIGLAFVADDGVVAADLVRNADAAMYQAKARGRDAVEIFDGALRERVVQQLALENALREAVSRNEITVHYQPIVETASGALRCVEALARWSHSQLGVVSPAEFIPIAEESGIIIQLGRHILDAACAQLAQWRQHPGGGDLRLSVNLSARQLNDTGVVDMVADAIARHGLDPRALTLEITESVFMEDVEYFARRLQEMRDLGVGLSVDDFGTGYSSLSYLGRFPVDALKIDRSLVMYVDTDPQQRAIADAIVQLAGALDLAVIAEGVETTAQAEVLTQLRCGLAQGFLFSRPVPAMQIEALLGHSLPLVDDSAVTT